MSLSQDTLQYLEELQDCLAAIEAWQAAVEENKQDRHNLYASREREAETILTIKAIPFHRRNLQQSEQLQDAKSMVKHIERRIAATIKEDTILAKTFVALVKDMPPDVQFIGSVRHPKIEETAKAAEEVHTYLNREIAEIQLRQEQEVRQPIDQFAANLPANDTQDLHDLLRRPRGQTNSN